MNLHNCEWLYKMLMLLLQGLLQCRATHRLLTFSCCLFDFSKEFWTVRKKVIVKNIKAITSNRSLCYLPPRIILPYYFEGDCSIIIDSQVSDEVTAESLLETRSDFF